MILQLINLNPSLPRKCQNLANRIYTDKIRFLIMTKTVEYTWTKTEWNNWPPDVIYTSHWKIEEKSNGKLNTQMSSVELNKPYFCTYINVCKCISETLTLICFQRRRKCKVYCVIIFKKKYCFQSEIFL